MKTLRFFQMNVKAFVVTLLTTLALTLSCTKEDHLTPNVPDDETVAGGTTVPYSVVVSNGTGTRAGIDGDGKYVFRSGDKLYLTSADSTVYGVLDLDPSSADTRTAKFDGTITYPGDEPSPELPLYATLVSSSDKIHSIRNTNFINQIRHYPTTTNSFASSLDEAISWYSDFTATGTYGGKQYALSQNSAFITFDVKFIDGTPEDHNIDVALSKAGSNIREGQFTTGKVGGDIKVVFATAFPSGFNTEHVLLHVNAKDPDIPEKTFNVVSKTLAGNNKYNINRIASTSFAVKATLDGTNVTFNYAVTADKAQYRKFDKSEDSWSSWTDYTTSGVGSITIDKDDILEFRSKRTTSYYNTGGASGTKMFTFSKKCLIYGDIMCLVSTGGEGIYNRGINIENDNEFNGAFWNMANMDIDPDNNLVLSATGLKEGCYKNMFRGLSSKITRGGNIIISASIMAKSCCESMFKQCQFMITAPVIKATELAEDCCRSMFSDCKLSVVPNLPATVMAKGCYRQMFYQVTSLVTVPSNLLSHVTELAEECYFSMFYGCTSLTNAPDLPAPVLVKSCYETMFGNTSINSIKCLAVEGINTENSTYHWLPNNAGTFTKKTGVVWYETEGDRTVDTIPSNWTVVEADE